MLRVLAVDDAPPILRLLEQMLSGVPCEITPATSGSEALSAAERQLFDVAVVDYQIPPPDGMEVLARLRELQPDCLRILVSGALNLDVAIDAVNRGEVSRVLEKPYDRPTLLRAIEEAVSMRRRAGERYILAQAEEQNREREQVQGCLEDDSLQLAVQPIVTAAQRRVVAFEGLLRSVHPVLDSPLALLRAAETHGLIGGLGALVARRAAEWIPRLPPEVKLFLNLHPDELSDPDDLRTRLDCLLPCAPRFVFEITEQSRLSAVRRWDASIHLLREMGFSLAVDDLGSGYSSLSVLAELRPRYMKIDMSIIRGIDTDTAKQRLVSLLSQFAETTEARVIAEGIETEKEAETVRGCGAHMLQGYLLGKPKLELEPALRP
jgi:EAL domain-containing protein (putative c-di-GMP-specific phosphodiesterase class I)